jgi:hypothetical protein
MTILLVKNSTSRFGSAPAAIDGRFPRLHNSSNPWRSEMEIGASIAISVGTGLITGAITCWYFYWLGGKDLKREVDDLRKLNGILIRGLHNAKILDASFDDEGNATGLMIGLSGRCVTTFRGSGVLRAVASVNPSHAADAAETSATANPAAAAQPPTDPPQIE